MRPKASYVMPLLVLVLPWVVLAGVFATNEQGSFPVDRKVLPPAAPGRAHAATDDVPSPVDKRLFAAARVVADKPTDPAAQAAFAHLLEQKAREVGNAAYHRMAENAARTALETDPDHALARAALGVALCGQHRFSEALAFVRSLTGEKQNVWRQACEFDALFELGRYDEATEMAQRLVDFKPGAESYPRVGQIRELLGDSQGSREVWQLAILAMPAGSANAWAATQAGDMELRQGELDAARAAYEVALGSYPDYHLARLGLARCAIARGGLAEAESLLLRLSERYGDLPTSSLLGDVEEALGKTGDADRAWEQAIATEAFSKAAGIPDRRGVAVFLADHDRDAKHAIELAREELSERPTVLAEDALAWALFKDGKLAEAREHSERARRFGTKNPWFLYHAARVELASGRGSEGHADLERALATGLRADPRQARCAEQLLGR